PSPQTDGSTLFSLGELFRSPPFLPRFRRCAMHARVISVQLKTGTAEEATRVYRESVLPAARRQPGFQRAMFLVDPITERAVSITQWATESDLAGSETSGYLREQVA